MPGGIRALSTTDDVNRIEAPVNLKAYLICAFASFGGIFFGYDSGYINGVLGSKLFIHMVEGPDQKALASSRQSLIVSILSAGTFFGAIIAGDVADIIGRKYTVIMGCAIYMFGVVIQEITGAGNALGAIVAGRLIAGLGVGFESAIVILYMSEIVRIVSISSSSRMKLTLDLVPKKGSWSRCFWLSILHHHRYTSGILRCLRHPESQRHRRLPHPHWYPIRLGSYPWRWLVVPSGLPTLLC